MPLLVGDGEVRAPVLKIAALPSPLPLMCDFAGLMGDQCRCVCNPALICSSTLFATRSLDPPYGRGGVLGGGGIKLHIAAQTRP